MHSAKGLVIGGKKTDHAAMHVVPFSIPNSTHGLSETTGIARLEKNELVLEYQVKDSVLGVIKSDVKERRVPISELVDVKYRKGFLWPSMKFYARSMSVFEDIPGHEQGELQIHFERKHRTAARRLHSSIEIQLSNQMLKEMTDDADLTE